MSDQGVSVHLRCADCGAEMLERENRVNGSRFLGCARYPACTHTQKIPAYLEVLRAGGTLLPGLE